jgi:hypothetical protein
MRHAVTGIKLVICLALLSAGPAFAQSPSDEEISKPTTTPAPVAHVYVQTTKGVNVCDATATGKLSLVKGSPFATVGQMEGITGKHLINVGTTYLHTYLLTSSGGVGKQVAEINTADYGGSECGSTSGVGAILDHSGKYFYVQLYDDGPGNCAAWQSYQITPTGEFTFIGDVVGDSYGDGNAVPSYTPTFDSSNRYGYGFAWNESLAQPGFVPFVRASNGNLMSNTVFSERDPKPDPHLDYYLVPDIAKSDPTGHLAVLMSGWFYGDNGGAPENSQLVSYPVDPATGSVVSTNTQDNAPFTVMKNANSMSMSYAGDFVAIGGDGLQVLNFSGAEPPTGLTGQLLPSVQVDQVAWDKANHLYALSYETEELYVYDVTKKGAVAAAGSPYKSAGAYGVTGVIVVPKI